MGRLIGLRTKLILLILIPIVLLCAAGSYSLMQTRELANTLIESLYTSTYKSSEMLLNADRDMYQAMTALKSAQAAGSDAESHAAQTASFEENVTQAADRIGEARSVWNAHLDIIQNGEARAAMEEQFRIAEEGLRDWQSSVSGVFAGAAGASDAERGELLRTADPFEPSFDAAREGLNQLAAIIDANAADAVAALDEQSDRLFVTFLVLVAIAAVLVLLTGWLLARNIRLSLSELGRLANAVADGELTQDDEAGEYARDEIGDLHRSMRRMTTQLRELIGAMAEVSRTVTASSRELTASADQTRQATGHIAASMQEMSAGADQTASSVTMDAQRVVRIVENADVTRSLLRDAAELASQVDGRATEGTRVIHHAVDRMETAEQVVQSLSGSVERLRDQSQSIAAFMDTIAQIASRTNVLALNAGIEAARAGEQGRGFAVVAAEIRKLAEQASRAASDAGELADNIVGGTAEATQAMEATGTEVATGLASVREANLSFEGIGRDVSLVAAQIAQMDEAAQRLEAEASDTDRSLGVIAGTVVRIADDIQSVSAAAEEQLASMEEVSGAAQQLSRLAEQLEGIIGRFRVKE